ncbi:MAG: hypothetical protein ORN58_07410, partial [Sediminibacterium sp.]|nr:hypothetical protein [Sediminibacterium sp.]
IIPTQLNGINNIAVGYYSNYAFTNTQIIANYDSNQVSVSIPANYNLGDKIIVQFNAKTGYLIKKIYLNDQPTDSLNSFTIGQLLGIKAFRVVSNSVNQPTILSVNKPVAKYGDTIVIRGNNIKSIQLQKGNYPNQYIVNYVSKTVVSNGLDTNYSFIMPNNLEDFVYIIKGVAYNNELSNFFLIKNYNHSLDSTYLVAFADSVRNIPNNLNGVVDFEAGNSQYIILTKEGNVLTWGNLTNVVYQNKKFIVWVNGLQNIVQVRISKGIGAGLTGITSHIIALKNDGTMISFGEDANGEVSSMPSNLENIVSVVAATAHSLALDDKGKVFAWGSNNVGQSTVPANLKKIIQIFGTVGSQSFLLQEDSTVIYLFGDSVVDYKNA